MEKEFRSIVFIIPAVPSAAVDASEMALDFLSKVDWLADDLRSLRTEICWAISGAMRRSVRVRHNHVTAAIDVFPQGCVIRISQGGIHAKQLTIHLMRGSAKSPDLDEDFSVHQEVCVS